MKKFTGIIWVFSPQFPIAFYFFEDFTIFIYFILFHLTKYLCALARYSVLFWFVYKPGNVEFRVIHTPITLYFPFPNGREDLECRMLSYRKHTEGHLLATSWRHVMNVIEWMALLYGCALSCSPFCDSTRKVPLPSFYISGKHKTMKSGSRNFSVCVISLLTLYLPQWVSGVTLKDDPEPEKQRLLNISINILGSLWRKCEIKKKEQ